MWEGLATRPRLTLTGAVFLALAGVVSWFTMPRQEDPRWPKRDGIAAVDFPGAGPESIERLILRPVEDSLVEVEELEKFLSTARAGIALFHLKLKDSIYETEAAWDKVERALVEASREFPQGVDPPTLDRDPYRPQSVVLGVCGSPDRLRLLDAARRLRRQLLELSAVAKIEIVGDPEEEIAIELEDAQAHRLGISRQSLASALAPRSSVLPAGSFSLGTRELLLRPRTELETIEDIAATPVMTAGETLVPLRAVARVRRMQRHPARQSMRLDGELAVGLAISPKDGVDMVSFGRSVRRRLGNLAGAYAPLAIREVAFQPDHVERRLRDLQRSLGMGIVIVGAVLFAAVGFRLALAVASIVPLVLFSSVAVYAAGGGVLHQVSIAALVLSLGLLVDNAIIIAESVQKHLDQGLAPPLAARSAVAALSLPLASATGTTLAAFLPLLLASGMVADFLRALPVVVMLALTMSFLFALLVTPTVSATLLKARRGRGDRLFLTLGRGAASLGLRHPRKCLLAAAVLVLGSLGGAGFIERSFFPSTDRAQLVVSVILPEGSPFEATDRASGIVEEALRRRREVRSVASFTGRSTPLFYYNLPRQPQSPHLAQLLVDVGDRRELAALRQWLRAFARTRLPEAIVVSRRLEQGRTVVAPIEVRLRGAGLPDLQSAARKVVAALREIPGSMDVRDDLGIGVPTVEVDIDGAAAERLGVGRAEVARALLGRTRGLAAGELRGGGERPIPILVRPASGGGPLLADLLGLPVALGEKETVALGEVARTRLSWSPGAIYHRNRVRTVTVYSELEEGVPYSRVVAALARRIQDLALPPSVRVEWGGEAEGSREADLSIMRTLPFGFLVLVFFVLAEFNSFRRLAIVLVTIPLAVTGIVPGLLLSGEPFGFSSLLGAVSLCGIVVNNAIVLLDAIESGRRAGRPPEAAVEEAVVERTRPVLLTTGTTVAGLLPLAFSSAPLWPPLAWSMISGLLASTALTLVIVPSLYATLVTAREAGVPGS